MLDTNEYKLLLAACRTSSENPAEAFTSIDDSRLDWNSVSILAERHRISPQLYCLMNAAQIPAPEELLNNLRGRFISNAARNAFMEMKTGELMRLFQDHSVKAVAYKGHTLALQAYGDTALRQYDDLDFLVPGSDMTKAVESLLASGFSLPGNLTARSVPTGVKFDIDWRLHRKDRDFTADLHPCAAGPVNCHDLTQKITEQSQSLAPGHPEIMTPSIVDSLILICIHGTKHLWTRLGWIADVYNLTYRLVQNGTNVRTVISRAQELKAERMVRLGLSLCRKTVGLPTEFSAGISESDRITGLQKESLELLESDVHMIVPLRQMLRYHIKSMDNPKSGIQYSLRFFIKPTQSDIEKWTLPSSLAWAYYLLRPLRLSGKYLIKSRF